MKHLLSTLALLLATSTGAHAAIVNHPDVNGVRAFQDTSTGTIWADLDNWMHYTAPSSAVPYASYADYLQALQAAGFVWATEAEVLPLLTQAAPATSVDRSLLFAAMSTDFGVYLEMLGGFVDGSPTTPVSYSRLVSLTWVSQGTSWFDLQTTNLNMYGGLFAYYAGPTTVGPGGEVPEPASLGLVGLALAAAAGMRRSNKR